MARYERLFEETRTSRRTIADALSVLRDAKGFEDSDQAEIRVGFLKLPSGDIVGLVNLFFEIPSQEQVCIVSLPTSAEFYGKRSSYSERYRFDIALLDRAVADGSGNVRLKRGTTLRTVEVIPAYLPLALSELDRRIVHNTISVLGIEERCYRRFGPELPVRYREMVATRQFFDCSRLPRRIFMPLSDLAKQIAARDKNLKTSQQKIADTLRTFGIRVPSLRPRVRAHPTATI